MTFKAAIVCLALIVVAMAQDKPVDIPCVTWTPLNANQPTDPTNLFLAAYTWVVTDQDGNCVGKGDIFPCFASDPGANTWGHHDYVAGEFDTDACRMYVNGSVYYSQNMYMPTKGPQWQTWTWQLAQAGGVIPDNAIRYGDKIMARNTANPPGMCLGKGFTGWAQANPDGTTFGQVHFSILKQPITMDDFEVAICTAYKPTPAPGTPAPPGPTPGPTPTPTLPPNNKPYIRFGNTIPTGHNVDAVITQGNITYAWTNVAFGSFSGWVEVFADGTGTIDIYENIGGTRGPVLVTTTIPLPAGPLVVVVKDFWPPAHPYNVETIAASYVPNPNSSGVRLFNLSPDTKSAGIQAGGTTLADNVLYTLGSVWVDIPQGAETFSVFDDATKKALATDTTSPPSAPFVFTNFLIGLQNATAGSTYATRVVPLIDAPEA